MKINIGGRVDDYKRRVDRIGGLPFTPQRRDQTAYSYRAGLVYAPRYDQQIYVATSSSFTPVTTVPADGSQLDPSTARNYEVGHRWQGWNGRVDTSLALYYIVRNNVTVQRVGDERSSRSASRRSRGLDLDVNTDLGGQTHLIFNYGFARPRFDDAEELTGLTPRFVPKHNVERVAAEGLGVGLERGLRRPVSSGRSSPTTATTLQLDGYTIVSGAVGYRTDRWEWSLNAENLFNKDDYFLPGHFSNQAFPGQPINVTSTIRLKFN